MTTLTLIRGLPGSGKSTLAEHLSTHEQTIEADQYFYDGWGNYVFDADKLKEAHEWCQNAADDYLLRNYSVIVSNTFTTLREMKEYYLMAKKHGAKLNVITCQGQFGSVHDVPEETMEKMRKRFFHGDVIKGLDELYGV